MNGFYASMIFIGILLIVASLIWVVFDKKSSFSYAKKLEERKQEMVSVISDAEQMMEELNKFSDYIVTQMDMKNDELRQSLKAADEEIKSLHARIADISAEAREKAELSADIRVEAAAVKTIESGMESKKRKVSGYAASPNHPETVQMPSQLQIRHGSDLIIESINYDRQVPKNQHAAGKQIARRTDKVIPLDSRYKEIVMLSNDGLTDTEIAKKLNMGKGEIQLILGINKS